MKTWLLVPWLVSLAGLLSGGCSNADTPLSTPIPAGSDEPTATHQDEIFLGSLAPDPEFSPVVYFNGCTATLVSVDAQGNGMFLTAAHCTCGSGWAGNTPPSNAFVQFGGVKKENRDTSDPNQKPVTDFWVIPNAAQPHSDLAVLKATGISPTHRVFPLASLAEQTAAFAQSNVDGVAAGFGNSHLNPSDPESKKRRQAPLKLIAQTPTQLTAQPHDAGMGQGDSGGPFLVKVGNSYKVAGAVSTTAPPIPGGAHYSRVSTEHAWAAMLLQDGTCESWKGKEVTRVSYCGDMICSTTETSVSCPADCGFGCPDGAPGWSEFVCSAAGPDVWCGFVTTCP